MKHTPLILILVLLLACGGCLTVKKFSLLHGLVAIEDFSIPIPTLYKFGSYAKDEDGTGMDIIHFERDPATLMPETAEDPEETPTP